MPGNLKGKKIVIISTVASMIETQFKGYVEALIDQEAEVSIITSSRVRGLNNYNYFELDIKREISIFHDIKTLYRLIRQINLLKADVVYTLTPKAGLLGIVAAYVCQIPARVHTFTGQVWATKRGPMRILLNFLDRVIAFCSTDLFTDSHSQRDFLLQHNVGSEKGIRIINKGSLSGVNLDRFRHYSSYDRQSLFAKHSLSIPFDSKVVLYLGRINTDKGIGDLLAVSKRFIKDNVHFLLVGPIEDVSFLDTIDNLGNVTHHGFTSKPEEYFALSDLLCIPSYREGFGSVVIEAAAVGIPSVGSEIYGLTDAIVSDQTGLLFPPGDLDKLASCLSDLIYNDDKRLLLGDTAHQRASKHFDSKIMERLFITECENIIGKNYCVNEK